MGVTTGKVGKAFGKASDLKDAAGVDIPEALRVSDRSTRTWLLDLILLIVAWSNFPTIGVITMLVSSLIVDVTEK